MPITWRARDPSSSRKPARQGSKASCRSGPTGPIISGRGKDWLKIKCTRGEEFVIGGYSRSEVKGKPFSSLLLGTLRGRQADLCRQGRHRLRRRRLRRACAQVQAARTRKLALRGGAARRAQGRGVARAEACRADRLHRADPRRKAEASELQGPARGQAGARGASRGAEQRGGRHAPPKSALAKTKAKGDPVFAGIKLTNPGQGALSRCRRHQARPRPLLRGGRALHPALCGQPPDQPRALPGGDRRGAASSSATP